MNNPIVIGKFKTKHKHWLVILIAVLISLLLVVGLLIWGVFRTQTTPQVSYVCTKTSNVALIKNAASIITNPPPGRPLATIAHKIKQMPNYQEDPNCLLVLFHYSLEQVNVKEAQSYLNQIDAIYPHSKGFSAYFGHSTTPASLKTILDNYSKALNQVRNNTRYLKRPSSL